ncbi:MAG: hypothetical protein EZS28_011944 [Streblomastix strix]|uniref:Uncharacterized protein n=1 Tax=Streblomastix strix TaxID=222440 RepID=A0A5J4WDW7_9EUKA|nr:MAG: hypothetical protein EZS28_011944 [Streblomastix strix]
MVQHNMNKIIATKQTWLWLNFQKFLYKCDIEQLGEGSEAQEENQQPSAKPDSDSQAITNQIQKHRSSKRRKLRKEKQKSSQSESSENNEKTETSQETDSEQVSDVLVQKKKRKRKSSHSHHHQKHRTDRRKRKRRRKDVSNEESSSVSSDSLQSSSAHRSSMSPTSMTRMLEHDTGESRHGFKPLEFQYPKSTLDEDKREELRVKSAWPATEPTALWPGHEEEDTVEALTYATAASKAILNIGDEIVKYSEKLFRKFKHKIARAYRLSQETGRRRQIVREKGAMLNKSRGVQDLPPPGLFRKNTWNQIKGRNFSVERGKLGTPSTSIETKKTQQMDQIIQTELQQSTTEAPNCTEVSQNED